jgi:hypothetical protein
VAGSVWRWLLAIGITLASLVWQVVSGPTYPVRGTVRLGGERIAMKLERSHTTATDQPVVVRSSDPALVGEIVWRRYPSSEPWQIISMRREGEELRASLPKQPAAGKLEYQVRLQKDGEDTVFPPRPAVTRFRGQPPAAVLVPHIAAMFLGMLLATRVGIEALAPRRGVYALACATLGLFVVGGFVLGPLVQHYAFGQWWTGVPFGWDLTDNKTLVAVLIWAFAVWRLRGGRRSRAATLAAAALTLAVFAVPHSTWGSQIDWQEQPRATGVPAHRPG